MNRHHIAVDTSVSIITSVYNGDRHIEHFLNDITRQTFFHHCELILINANSPGNEAASIEKAMESYNNIRYVNLGYDPGLYETWNMAIRLANGKYITNANLDDRRAPRHIEEHVKILDRDPDVSLVAAPSLVTKGENETWESNSHYDVWFDDSPTCFTFSDLFRVVSKSPQRRKSTPLSRKERPGMQIGSGAEYVFHESGLGYIAANNIPHAMPVWRKDLHVRHGWFDERTWGSSADWEFWLRCASQGELFKLLPEPLCLYLETPLSYERRFTEKKKIERKIIDKYYPKK